MNDVLPDRCSEEDLITALVNAGVDNLGLLKSLGQKANASINFTQPTLAIDVITILGSIAIGCCPTNRFCNRRSFHLDKLLHLRQKPAIADRSDVVRSLHSICQKIAVNALILNKFFLDSAIRKRKLCFDKSLCNAGVCHFS